MTFAISIGGFTFELTRIDVLLKIGKRQAYWCWRNDDGLIFEKLV
jgi:hypothetical protein